MPVAKFVMRADGNEHGGTPCHTLFTHDGDVVFTTESYFARRQRRKQGRLVVPFLDQDRLAVRQDAMDLIANTDNLEAIVLLGYYPFANDTIGNGMCDFERLGLTITNANDRALVAGLLYGGCHTIQPFVRPDSFRQRLGTACELRG